MGRAIHALTGRAARHENTEIYLLGQHFPKKSSLGIFATNKIGILREECASFASPVDVDL